MIKNNKAQIETLFVILLLILVSISTAVVSTNNEETTQIIKQDFDPQANPHNETYSSPITVNNSTGENAAFATRVASQRKTFYANGRHWIFYSNYTEDDFGDAIMSYTSSLDGTTWEPLTFVSEVDYCSAYASVYYDGTYVHYTYDTHAFYYMRGYPNANGTIDWGNTYEVEDFVTCPDSTITVDTSGYVYIGTRKECCGDYNPWVYKNKLNNGSWEQDFRKDVNYEKYYFGIPLALTNDKVYTVTYLSKDKYDGFYNDTSDVIKGRLYDGSNWQSHENISTSNISVSFYSKISAVSIGDEVHIVFLANESNNITYINGTVNETEGTWNEEVVLYENAQEFSSPVLSYDANNNDLYVFWGASPEEDCIYYLKHNTTWDTMPIKIANESTTGLARNDSISVAYCSNESIIDLIYMVNDTGEFLLRHLYLNTQGEESNSHNETTSTPVVVNNCTGGRHCQYSTRVPSQRKTFYANGRHWIFYSNYTETGYNANMSYTSSTDGINWEPLTYVSDVYLSSPYSCIFYDGTYVHYVYYEGDTFYNRGYPNATGTINWTSGVNEDLISYFTVGDPVLAIDSSGYAFIGTRREGASWWEPRVLKNEWNNGTWSTEFDDELNYSLHRYLTIPVALTNDKVYAIYFPSKNAPSENWSSGVVRGMLWNGSEWMEEEIISTSDIDPTYYNRISAVAIGDEVHIVFLTNESYNITYINGTVNDTAGTWSSETVLYADAQYCSPQISFDSDNLDLYVLWAGTPDNDSIYYLKHNTTWDTTPIEIVNESSTGLARRDCVSVAYQSNESIIDAIYMVNDSGNMTLKHFYFNTQGGPAGNSPPVFSNPNPANESATVPISTTMWNITIEDPDGDTFNWTIETVPNIGSNSSNDDINGSKFINVTGNLTSETEYTVYVNATGSSTNETYWFITESIGNITITNPTPENNSVGAWPYTSGWSPYSTYEFTFDLYHSKGKKMDWEVWYMWSGNWYLMNNDEDVTNGTVHAYTDYSVLPDYDTLYYWSVNVTNSTDGDGDAAWHNRTFSFTTGNQSHITLDNLTGAGSDNLVFFATEQDVGSYVWCNSSKYDSTTMVVNITVNDSVPDGYVNSINVNFENLDTWGESGRTYYINASNITLYVSADEDGTYHPIQHDLGNGNGTFLDGSWWEGLVNITINADTWGLIPNNPWVVHGDGENITESTNIFLRFRAEVPYFTPEEIADFADDNYFSFSNTYIWANRSNDAKALMYQEYDGHFYYEQEYVIKSGYDNCPYGPADFDQKQNENNWRDIFGKWVYCGPTALANCLWWLDCKYNNGTKNYDLPDFTGEGSKDPSNVIPLIDWLSEQVHTEVPIIPEDNSGTSAENMTQGILNVLNITNLSNKVNLTIEGYNTGENWDENNVNYTNVTNQLDNCSDVILLLGFWCEYGPAMYGRIGGHYVQVAGYDSQQPGLLLADPYKDNAEEGGDGWYSDHNHDLYGNSSHNWTQNVSYDYYSVSYNSFSPPGNWMEIDNYTDNMGNLTVNWSMQNEYDDTYPCCDGMGGCWCYECLDLVTIVEAAWYIHEGSNCNLTMSKTIWNGTDWVEWYENTTIGENLLVNFSITNNGATIKSLQVMDYYRDAWNYTEGTTIFYLLNGTSYEREPNVTIPCSGTTCSDARHGFLYWYLNYTDDCMPLMPGESIWIHTNWTVLNNRYSYNELNIDVCLCNDSCTDWMYFNCSYEDTAYINPQFNTSIDCWNCNNSNEASNWSVSEHVHRNCTTMECFDQGWMHYETDYSKWYSYNTGYDDWQWTYRYYDTTGDGGDSWGLSYVIANDSCSNRSMSLARMRAEYDWMGVGEYEIPTVGIIYAFQDNNNYDMVLFGDNTTYLLSKASGLLTNTEDGTVVHFPGQAYNYYTDTWICDDGAPLYNLDISYPGIWAKILWNEHCGSIQAKGWNISLSDFSDMCHEPSGWITNFEDDYAKREHARCFGLVVWNPENLNSSDLLFSADFDWVDMWELNYSRDEEANATAITNHAIYENDGIPLMSFPQFEASSWANNYIDWYYDCYTEYFNDNITLEDYRDCSYCFYKNMSSLYSMESRPFYPEVDCGAPYRMNDQNDSIYYYTGVVTDIDTEYLDFNNAMIFEIQDASDGTSDIYDTAIVAIDIDNNMEWDDNDMLFLWYNKDYVNTSYVIYRGDNLWDNGTAGVANSDIYFEVGTADCPFSWKIDYLPGVDYSLPALHRYSNHTLYYIRIPMYYLLKSNGEMLNENDTFGLHVQTVNADWGTFWEPANGNPVWENWNESGCTNYTFTENTPLNMNSVFDYYLNLSSQYEREQFLSGSWNGTYEEQIKMWAHGRIGTETGYMTENFVNVSTNCTDQERSELCVWENVYNETFNHNWSEYESDCWHIINTSKETFCPDWKWTYRYNDSDGTKGDVCGLSYTIANNSCTNLSEMVLKMRYYSSEELMKGESYVGLIYSYINKNHYNMILYGTNETFLLTYYYGILYNTEDVTVVVNSSHAINYWTENWPCNDTYEDSVVTYCLTDLFGQTGLWTKTNFNEKTGKLQVKGWTVDGPYYEGEEPRLGLCLEPPGWIVDKEIDDIETTDTHSFGLVIWNPYHNQFVADFDFIKDWRVNYSRDEEATIGQELNHSCFGQDGIPLIEFPTFNMSTFNNTKNQWIEWRNQWLYGNISNNTYYDKTDLYVNQMMELLSMEGRQFNFTTDCTNASQNNDQNDTIYYYTAVITELVATEGREYNNALRIHIEDCTDGTKDYQIGRNNFMSDGAVLAIDVDNNMQWDDNDIAVCWYAGVSDTSNFTIWKGTTILFNETSTEDYQYHIYNRSCPYNISALTYGFPAFHRYSSHRTYDATLPLYYLVKENGQMLNVNDTFGFHLMNINFRYDTALTPVWENWNESSGSFYTASEEDSAIILNAYLNLTTDQEVMDFFNWTSWNGVNESNIQYWGHGRILNTSGWLQEGWIIDTITIANVSNITNIATDNLVNYTIIVCSNGSKTLTNVTVNITLPSGVVYVNTSLPYSNVTGSDKNWTFNATLTLNSTYCVTFNITVNFTAGCAPNGTYVVLFQRAYADEPVTSENVSLIYYGENTAPVINWTYPADDSNLVSLPLANISCCIYDLDGDNMDVYFWTNKSGWGDSVDTWTPVWNQIGTNSTIPNGIYECNQTFNNSNLYNTKWRWGNTMYYISINVTDGKVWTNQTVNFTTESSRYDVTTSGDVVINDVVRTWDYRAGVQPYRGIYDVNGGGDVTIADVVDVWDNHT